jgi:hypothetical protein
MMNEIPNAQRHKSKRSRKRENKFKLQDSEKHSQVRLFLPLIAKRCCETFASRQQAAEQSSCEDVNDEEPALNEAQVQDEGFSREPQAVKVIHYFNSAIFAICNGSAQRSGPAESQKANSTAKTSGKELVRIKVEWPRPHVWSFPLQPATSG